MENESGIRTVINFSFEIPSDCIFLNPEDWSWEQDRNIWIMKGQAMNGHFVNRIIDISYGIIDINYEYFRCIDGKEHGPAINWSDNSIIYSHYHHGELHNETGPALIEWAYFKGTRHSGPIIQSWCLYDNDVGTGDSVTGAFLPKPKYHGMTFDQIKSVLKMNMVLDR